jgi:hypothetical protein
VAVTTVAVPIAAIGWRAHAALSGTAGAARVLAPLTTSIYLEAGGEIIWVGPSDGLRHPRAVLAAAAEPWPSYMARIQAETVGFDIAGLHPWRPPRSARAAAAGLGRAARDLVAVLRRPVRPAPLGLGRLLLGHAPDFPLDRAVDPVMALAAACDADDPTAVVAAADALLGLGPGLTPSGDDFVGGVLCARNWAGTRADDWSRAAALVIERARTRTHPISVALLEDLAAGEGHEPLHDVVDALIRRDERRALAAVEQLGALGHSSGWDMLTGLLVGIGGRAVLAAFGDDDPAQGLGGCSFSQVK